MEKAGRGVFWLIEGELLICPYDGNVKVGVAKSGENYNHRLLWDHVKPPKCGKSFDYYPRGRIEIGNKGKLVIYMNPNIGAEYIPIIMEKFGLSEVQRVHYDGSNHYRSHLDREDD